MRKLARQATAPSYFIVIALNIFAVFSNGENRQESDPEKCPKRPFLPSRQWDGRKRRTRASDEFHGGCRKRNSPLTGEPSMGCGKSDGRTRRGDLEPFSSVLQSLTCDLFESQPSGERKPVVLHLGKRLKRPFRPQLAWMGHLRGEWPKSEER